MRIQAVPEIRAIDLYGGWPSRGRDQEMNTGGGAGGLSFVPVTIASHLVNLGSSVDLEVYFRCVETPGNTRFEGWRTFKLYNPPPGWRVVSVRPTGTVQRGFEVFNTEVFGKSHDRRAMPIPTRRSLWTKLEYRVDSGARDDSSAVGVGGIIAFDVDIAPQ